MPVTDSAEQDLLSLTLDPVQSLLHESTKHGVE